MNYSRLSLNERIEIEIKLKLTLSIRSIAKSLDRAPSTISREIQKIKTTSHYRATTAHYCYLQARKRCSPKQKLKQGNVLFGFIIELLQVKLSPEQISGVLKNVFYPQYYVCKETIYNAIYALPVGELKKDLIACLRQEKKQAQTKERLYR